MPVTFNNKLAIWEALNTNLKPHLADLPHLQKGQAELEALIRRGFELVAQQNQYTGLASQSVAERRQLDERGTQIAEFLAAGLRHAFGGKSQKLREFGVKPRIRRRAKKEEPPGGAEGPEPSAPTPTSPS